MNRCLKHSTLFIIGGLAYLLVELAWRGYTHWTMFFVGGFCFTAVGLINEVIPWEMPLPKQMFLGSLIITSTEFISGVLINIILGMNVWDYSDVPFNVFGQICLHYMILWYFLSLVAIYVDDYLRYLLFDEEEPKYR